MSAPIAPDYLPQPITPATPAAPATPVAPENGVVAFLALPQLCPLPARLSVACVAAGGGLHRRRRIPRPQQRRSPAAARASQVDAGSNTRRPRRDGAVLACQTMAL
jgi:hypothetical protein